MGHQILKYAILCKVSNIFVEELIMLLHQWKPVEIGQRYQILMALAFTIWLCCMVFAFRVFFPGDEEVTKPFSVLEAKGLENARFIQRA